MHLQAAVLCAIIMLNLFQGYPKGQKPIKLATNKTEKREKNKKTKIQKVKRNATNATRPKLSNYSLHKIIKA